MKRAENNCTFKFNKAEFIGRTFSTATVHLDEDMVMKNVEFLKVDDSIIIGVLLGPESAMVPS